MSNSFFILFVKKQITCPEVLLLLMLHGGFWILLILEFM